MAIQAKESPRRGSEARLRREDFLIYPWPAMRLFVGIGLEPQAAQDLERMLEPLAASARDLRCSEPESWHVTLLFLGAATDEQAACLVEKLGGIQAARVPVQIAGLGFFERAGAFWAGVELTAELLALQQKVTAATRACGFVPEDRAYNPHITLARAKGRRGGRALAPKSRGRTCPNPSERGVRGGGVSALRVLTRAGGFALQGAGAVQAGLMGAAQAGRAIARFVSAERERSVPGANGAPTRSPGLRRDRGAARPCR